MIPAYPLTWPAGWPRTPAEYEVSKDGHVYSVRDGQRHRMAEHPDQDGYLCVLVRIGPGKRRNLRIHRAVCEAFNGSRPSRAHVVRHYDGNKLNNGAGNLLWGTVADNSADAVRLGETARGLRNGSYTKPHTRRRGETNGNSKLKAEQVERIFVDGRSQTVIAAEYGVTQMLVSQIKRGRIWNHVTGMSKPAGGS